MMGQEITVERGPLQEVAFHVVMRDQGDLLVAAHWDLHGIHARLLWSPGPGVNQTIGRTRGIGGCPRLHRGLYVGRRMMQRGEHQDGADSQADRDGDCEGLIGSNGLLSSACGRRIGAG